jgi:hypothetical protein
MQRLHGCDQGHLVVLAPGQKRRHRAAVGPSRIGVPDPRREEFQKAERGALSEDAISAGSGRCVVVILRGGVSWVTTREPVVIYPDLAS